MLFEELAEVAIPILRAASNHAPKRVVSEREVGLNEI
jgi:hypothetical protein